MVLLDPSTLLHILTDPPPKTIQSIVTMVSNLWHWAGMFQQWGAVGRFLVGDCLTWGGPGPTTPTLGGAATRGWGGQRGVGGPCEEIPAYPSPGQHPATPTTSQLDPLTTQPLSRFAYNSLASYSTERIFYMFEFRM